MQKKKKQQQHMYSFYRELFQDNRWMKTYFSKLPLDLIIDIFHKAWKNERREFAQYLTFYYNGLARERAKERNFMLRNRQVFEMIWQTPNGVYVTENFKIGEMFVKKRVDFIKKISVQTQWDEFEPLPELKNQWSQRGGVELEESLGMRIGNKDQFSKLHNNSNSFLDVGTRMLGTGTFFVQNKYHDWQQFTF
jgi:ribonuclease D